MSLVRDLSTPAPGALRAHRRAGHDIGVALTATSGWLIVQASTMPAILTLLVAIVCVRTFGIARPVLRYAERVRSTTPPWPRSPTVGSARMTPSCRSPQRGSGGAAAPTSSPPRSGTSTMSSTPRCESSSRSSRPSPPRWSPSSPPRSCSRGRPGRRRVVASMVVSAAPALRAESSARSPGWRPEPPPPGSGPWSPRTPPTSGRSTPRATPCGGSPLPRRGPPDRRHRRPDPRAGAGLAAAHHRRKHRRYGARRRPAVGTAVTGRSPPCSSSHPARSGRRDDDDPRRDRGLGAGPWPTVGSASCSPRNLRSGRRQSHEPTPTAKHPAGRQHQTTLAARSGSTISSPGGIRAVPPRRRRHPRPCRGSAPGDHRGERLRQVHPARGPGVISTRWAAATSSADRCPRYAAGHRPRQHRAGRRRAAPVLQHAAREPAACQAGRLGRRPSRPRWRSRLALARRAA